MLANRQALGDFKENVKLSSAKPSLSSSRKGLKSRSLNSFNDSSNGNKIKKHVSESNTSDCKLHWEEDTKCLSTMNKVCKEKAVLENDDWSDIEEMHICIEPDDDYEDILPKCERIQKSDIDSLFMTYTFTNFVDLNDHLLASVPELDSINFPPSPPSSPIPQFEVTSYDDTPLEFVPLPIDLSLDGGFYH